ncbi:hypothetical protein DSO57_1017708 [Entomophthora muscae]|uniref:Uncharacterized protein n=1 Tax=Entomophthora muscae TaxID=34485 RepID=A0ACC2U3M9_9FUNG|nr:hypothetical protein DSO57_1017708 [Entomophthora muscae]
MTLPLTLWPNCPQESVAANQSTSTQIFGVITNLVVGPSCWARRLSACKFPRTPTGWIPDRSTYFSSRTKYGSAEYQVLKVGMENPPNTVATSMTDPSCSRLEGEL